MRRFWDAIAPALDGLYVMFFGAGDRWSVWAVVMVGLVLLILGTLTAGFEAAPTFTELAALAAFVGVSALGVHIRRKRKDEQ
ncbi:hypothetical protein [Pseudorhodobacter sp.]|uniref:hypothetical protein n=1 Tax=Pseudorhodobacter sp. TaxID=1934400 RepID=UPI00264A4974|nr:hypothetical protein [Pseudorhodobacter sp.]MDN5786660.1 hypothetical protein [Pseudorhodobacter sp.]